MHPEMDPRWELGENQPFVIPEKDVAAFEEARRQTQAADQKVKQQGRTGYQSSATLFLSPSHLCSCKARQVVI